MEPDEKLTQIERSIKEMEKAKARRIEELADPRRKAARAKWEELARIFRELEDMGEDPVDLNMDALHINGNTFSLSASGELIEH